MFSSYDSLPVKIEPKMSDLIQGTYEIQGLLRCQDKALVLEYKPVNYTQALLSEGKVASVETITLPLSSLRAVELKSSMFNSRLIIETMSMALLDGVPGSESNRLVLRIPWKARKDAQSFASFVRAELSEIKLDEM